MPGVSGSAVAIVFKLYEKLLYALGSFFRKFKTSLLFLLPIDIGLVAGVAMGFFGVRELLGVILFAVGVAAAYFFVKCERKNGKKKENIKNLS